MGRRAPAGDSRAGAGRERTPSTSSGSGAERVGFEPTDELPRHLLSREARSTRLRHLSVLRRRSYTGPETSPAGLSSGAAYAAGRSGGRADECTGLENRRPARARGFESLPLRSQVSRWFRFEPGCARGSASNPVVGSAWVTSLLL